MNEKSKITITAEEWIASEKGRRVLKENREKTLKAIEELKKARELDPAMLHQPMTI